MLAFDVYVNETRRHADVILPSPSPFEHSHYDIAFYQLAVRNIANYTAALMEPPPGMRDDWENVLRLAGVVTGQGADADIDAIDGFVAGEVARRAGIDPADHPDAMARRGPERLLDLLLRAGPYALTLADLEAAPHGIDLGPLEPRIPEMLRTASG